MAEILDLGQLRVQAPVSYRAVKAITVAEQMNGHGRLELCLILDGSLLSDLKRLEQSPIEVRTAEGGRVFCGVCTNYRIEQLAQYQELSLTAATWSYLADIEPKSRTFQSSSKTLQTMLEEVLGGYGALLSFQENPAVSQMVYQQNETDWAFSKRIANQFGLSLFVNAKTNGIQISVGTQPFAVHAVEQLPDDSTEKDLELLRLHQQTVNPQLMAFEMEQRGGAIADLSLGVGHFLQKDGRRFVIVHSEIKACFGTLLNHIRYTSPAGAIPRPAQAPDAPAQGGSGASGAAQEQKAPSLHSTNIISGQVLEVSGCEVKVQFDSGSGGTRWIPYASAISDCVYVMPDVGDTVYCYFENDGAFVCLGSKHINTDQPDFSRPEEKVLTSKNRMIKFKGGGLDLTGSRSELDGQGGMQLKVTLSDGDGIEIAATRDVTFAAKGKVYIQGVEQEPDDPAKSQEILQGQRAKAEQFREMENQGASYQTAHGGPPGDPSLAEAGWNALCEVGQAVVEDIGSPFFTVASWFKGGGGGGSESKAVDNKIHFDAVEDKEVAIFGLSCCKLQVQESYLMIDSTHIYGQSPVYHQLGFYRGRSYEQMVENTNGFLDNLLDGIQLVLDIVGMVGSFFPPLNIIASAANAAISVCRGDFAGAATNLLGCIPGGSVLGFAEKALTAKKKLGAVVKVLKWLGKIDDFIGNVQLVIGIKDTVESVGTFLSVAFSDASGQEKWDAFYNMANHMKSYISPVMKTVMDHKAKKAALAKPEGPEQSAEGEGADKPRNPSEGEGAEAGQKQKQAGTVEEGKTNSCGDPIDMVSGSQRMTNTDFVVKEIGEDFQLVRIYESRYENKGGLLGSRWFLNIETRVWMEGETAVVILPDMHLEHFVKTEEGWRSKRSGDGVYQLSETESGFCLYLVREKKQFQFDPSGSLSMITDRNQNRIWLRYLGSTLQRMEFSSGQALEFTYEANKLSGITDVIGRKVRYTYEGELLTSARLADEGTIQYSYTPEGWIASVIDQNGHEYVRNEYDLSGRVTRQFLATGEEFVVLYDDGNRINTFQTIGKGDQMSFHYNKDKLVEKQVYPDGSSEEKRYDSNQNVVWQRDRNGGELFRVYDEQSRLLEERLPNGLITWFSYDEAGNLARQWDNSGRERLYRYDGHGNQTELQVLIEGDRYSVYQFQYDSRGRLTALTDPNGNTTTYRYGAGPAPECATLPDGRQIEYSYDAAGRCLCVRSEDGERRYSYNNLDFLCLMTDPMGHQTSWEFDRLGNLIRFLLPRQYEQAADDRLGTRFYYDAMDKLVASVDSMGSVYATPRDRYGNVRKEINPNAYEIGTKDGEGIVYDYDVEDRRIRIHYPGGGVERIFYDACGNLIKKVQPLDYDPVADDGPGYCYTYDEVNRLVQVTAPDGTVEKRYVYDRCGNIIKLIEGTGYLAGKDDESRIGTLYRYNAAGWLTQKREPAERKETGELQYSLTEYRYDRAGNLVEERRYQEFQSAQSMSGAVHSIYYTYDADNRLVQVGDSTGAVVKYGYDSANRRTVERRKLGEDLYQAFHWKYDAAGRMTELSRTMDRADGSRGFSITAYSYDKNGNITKIQTPTGGEVLREYDAADRLSAELHVDKSSGIHNRTVFSYDKAGNLVQITDNQGRSTRIEYDLLNREIRRIERDGGITRSFYDGNGRLAKVVRPNQYNAQADDGAGYQYTYDHRGQVLTVIGPDGHVLQTNTYDAGGRLLQQLDGAGGGASFAYNLAGQRTHIRTQGGSSQELEYDARGNIIGVVDGNQNRTRYRLDAWGRIVGIIKPDGSTEYYSYDYAGNMTSSTDGEGHTTQYQYNRAGKIAAIVDPSGEEEHYIYDGEDRLIQRTDRNGVTLEFGYNLYGTLLFQREKGSVLGDFYEYTPEGFLKCAISSGMRYAYEYDAMGRLTRKSASGRTLLAMAYDKNGNKIQQVDVTKKVTEYRYSSLDFLEKVYDDGQELADYTYHPDGTIKSQSHGPITQEYTYDLDKNLTALKVQSAGKVLADNLYQYDGNGNRTLKRQLGGDTLYHYDPLNQLKKVEYPGYTEELFYDKAGNRTRRLAQGAEEFYQYDPRNRLISYTKDGMTTPFQYDRAGNLLVDDKAYYSYDAFNRTVKVETFDGNIQVNRYDAEGLRHEMEENGALVQFIFNQNREAVLERDNRGIDRLIRGTELIARSTDSARMYYHYASDEMGSTSHIVDEAGTIQNRYEYDAWGNVTVEEEAVPNRFKFTGELLDPITQQYYLRARFYNPVIARFTQEDAYRGDGLNLYAYCANNPIFYLDPTGHNKASAWGTDSKGRTTYTDGAGNTYKQDVNGMWHDSSGRYTSDPTINNQLPPSAGKPGSNPTQDKSGFIQQRYRELRDANPYLSASLALDIARNEAAGKYNPALPSPDSSNKNANRKNGQYHSFYVHHLDPSKRYSSDPVQFRIANKALQSRLQSDPAFRREMFGRYPGLAEWSQSGDMGASLKDAGLVWHHDPESFNRNGTFDLQLCDWNDHHDNPSIYNNLSGQGGRSVWGGGKEGRRGHRDQNGNLLPGY